MSTVTPTLIPRLPAVPSFLPAVPTPHPTPLPPKAGSGGILERRNLRAEFEWLSEEEDEVESKWKVGIQSRGFNHLRVIGRLHTRQEERNDTYSDSGSSNSNSGDRASIRDEAENPSSPENEQDIETEEQDLDADMEDFDEDLDSSGSDDMEDEDGQEEREEER